MLLLYKMFVILLLFLAVSIPYKVLFFVIKLKVGLKSSGMLVLPGKK